MSASRLLYGITVFLGAFLLFLIEPIAAKQLLPVLGGSSAVWLTCLVFFQLALLLGYLYAHTLARSGAGRLPERLYVALLIAAMLVLVARPLGFARGSEHPVTTIFLALSVSIGLPFLLLSSTSPLLQVWFLRTEGGAVPYRLFALSNAGSLLALIAYPFMVEPFLTLRAQRVLWSAGFFVYAVLCILLARKTKAVALPTQAPPDEQQIPGASTSERILWFLLPMAATMQLSAVTAHLTANIAAIPLLWMLPLAAYLLTFILAFEFPALYRRAIVVRLLAVMLASLGYAISKSDLSLPIGVAILFFLAEAFVAGLFCHAETFFLRPAGSRETTLFYLLIAAGGAVGTFLIGIASPLLFSANYDLALSFLVTAILAIVVTWKDGWGQRLLWVTASGLLLFFAFMLHAAYARQAILQVRNFYGALRVKQTAGPHGGDTLRMLLNGTIQHGTQIFSPDLSRTPTTYYSAISGVGLALRFCCGGWDGGAARARNIGVIGLGAGTLAAYGRPGDRLRFYEINPLVLPIAQNLFTYLRDSPASLSFAPGDARASLASESPQKFDVLVIDAFSGDAIPLHLLTTQAVALYRRHLVPDGILAFHVSNQYLDLTPEVGQLAVAANLEARVIESPANDSTGAYRATWVLVSAQPTFFDIPELRSAARPIFIPAHLRTWTDDYSSVLPLLRLSHTGPPAVSR
ncbi:MAG: fused MFS/spermidine synthase [Acidobacteriota bacterium]|nr:fused MFS/spermidine synthase [Acidobacteriota bacterium]